MKKITTEFLRRCGACCNLPGERYSDENLAKVRIDKGLPLLDILEKKGPLKKAMKEANVPDVDLLWLATQKGTLSAEQTYAWVAATFARALKKTKLAKSPKLIAVLRLLQQQSKGKTFSRKEKKKVEEEAVEVCYSNPATVALGGGTVTSIANIVRTAMGIFKTGRHDQAWEMHWMATNLGEVTNTSRAREHKTQLRDLIKILRASK